MSEITRESISLAHCMLFFLGFASAFTTGLLKWYGAPVYVYGIPALLTVYCVFDYMYICIKYRNLK